MNTQAAREEVIFWLSFLVSAAILPVFLLQEAIGLMPYGPKRLWQLELRMAMIGFMLALAGGVFVYTEQWVLVGLFGLLYLIFDAIAWLATLSAIHTLSPEL